MDNTSLKVTVTPLVTEPCLATLTIEIAQEDALVVYNKVEKAMAAKANLPGFRPGKLPKSVLQKQFGPQICARATEELIDKGYSAALKESGYDKKIAGSPALSEASQAVMYEIGKPFSYSVEVEIKPDFEMPVYKDLELSREVYEIKDEDVEKQVTMFLEMSAKMEKTEGPTVAEDIVTADYTATVPEGIEIAEADKYVVKADNAWLALREPAQLPGISKSLAGMKPAEERDIEVAFPEDFRIDALKGKTLQYHVKINEIRSRVLPELNDDFVKTFGLKTVDEFKTTIRKRLEISKEQEVRGKMIDQIDAVLFKDLAFELPPKHLKQTCNSIYRNKLESEKRAGTSEDDLKAKDNELKQDALDVAKDSLRKYYVMQSIIEAEAISISEDDYRQMLYFYAQQSPDKDIKKVMKEKQESGEFNRYMSELLAQKAYDKIISLAKVTEVKPEN